MQDPISSLLQNISVDFESHHTHVVTFDEFVELGSAIGLTFAEELRLIGFVLELKIICRAL